MKYYIFIVLFVCSTTISAHSNFSTLILPHKGYWKGNIEPEIMAVRYLENNEMHAAIVVIEGGYYLDRALRKCCSITPNERVYITRHLSLLNPSIQKKVIEQAKSELYKQSPDKKILRIQTAMGYKILSVAKFVPYFDEVISSNEAFMALCPGCLHCP